MAAPAETVGLKGVGNALALPDSRHFCNPGLAPSAPGQNELHRDGDSNLGLHGLCLSNHSLTLRWMDLQGRG